jgi:hypothetical protein
MNDKTISPQRRAEIRMMFDALADYASSWELNQDDVEIKAHLDKHILVMANALREVGYECDADFLEHEITLPNHERCDLWDAVESTAMDFDDELYPEGN